MCKITHSAGVLVICLFISSGFCSAESGNGRAKLKAEVDSILQSQVDMGKIPGAVLLIKKDDRVLCRKAYGYAQNFDFNQKLLARPERMTLNHMFDLASLTKAVGITTSIMLLTDRGLLKPEDPVCKYIEAFNTPEKKDITIRHLLTHTAGLYEWYPLYYRVSSREACYRLIGELPLAFPVGKQRRYSDLGFVLLGEIIEIVSGLPLEQFMNENIFQPLGMKHTSYNPLENKKFRKIAATSAGNPYEKRMVHDSTLGFTFKEIDPDQWNGWRTYLLRGEVNDGNTWYANGGISGAAGLFSTADDLQKLIDMLISRGMAGSKEFISAATIESFLTMDEFRNGLGWMMDPANSFMKNAPEGSFGHTGFTGTSIAVVPHDKLSVILLINRQNTGLSEEWEYYNVNPVRLQIFNAVSKYH